MAGAAAAAPPAPLAPPHITRPGRGGGGGGGGAACDDEEEDFSINFSEEFPNETFPGSKNVKNEWKWSGVGGGDPFELVPVEKASWE